MGSNLGTLPVFTSIFIVSISDAELLSKIIFPL